MADESLLLIPRPMRTSATPDARELAALLEKCLFRDPVLSHAYRRHYEDSDQESLGLTWSGALELFANSQEFIQKSREFINALGRVILTAFGGKKIDLEIKCGAQQVVLKCDTASLPQVVSAIEAICEALPKPQRGGRKS